MVLFLNLGLRLKGTFVCRIMFQPNPSCFYKYLPDNFLNLDFFQIQSPNIEEKLCGLQSLVTLAEKSDAVDTIVQNNVIKILAPFVVDKNSEVRNLTTGILR